MSSSAQPTLRAVAWDPKAPDKLCLARLDEGQPTLDTVWACTGVGCNSFERSALMNILQAHDKYQQGRKTPEDIKELSRKFRLALLHCLGGWEEQQRNDPNPSDSDVANYALLNVSYAVIYLAGVFLPLVLDLKEDPYETPGAATADVVRYLRFNHIRTMDRETIDEMLESERPEEFGDGKLYWNYVKSLVLQGCLEQAWEVLEQHSLYQAAATSDEGTDSYYVRTMNDARDGFLTLKELLVRAPLPGGRNSDFDDGASPVMTGDQITDPAESYYLDGLDVKPSDYTLWEYRLSSDANQGEAFRFYFDPDMAMNKYRNWKEIVRTCQGPSFTLTEQVPELASVLSILAGDSKEDDMENRTWAEKLCAELLYKYPEIKPSRIGGRTQHFMGGKQDELPPDVALRNDIILGIMQGNFGNAIVALNAYGASSGAALPSTLTALLFNMLIDSDMVDPEDAGTFTNQVEFLCDAASAIVSALEQSTPDLGCRLAIQLLMPYADKEESSTAILTAMAGILEHYCPDSNQSAETLIDACRSLMERKSFRILDGCTSVVLCRYEHYVKVEPSAKWAIRWLLTGLELESLVLESAPEYGSCYRQLVGTCQTTSCRLLSSLVSCLIDGADAPDVAMHTAAEQMVTVLQDENNAFDIETVPPTKELVMVLSLFNALIASDFALAAGLIVDLLEDRKSKKTGIVGCLASVPTHWPLLRLARLILDEDGQDAEGVGFVVAKASFDRKGITVLMEKLTQVIAFSSEQWSGKAQPTEEEIEGMREALACGLARAFVVENAEKKLRTVQSKRRDEGIEEIMTVDLHKHSLHEREMVVQSMLDY